MLAVFGYLTTQEPSPSTDQQGALFGTVAAFATGLYFACRYITWRRPEDPISTKVNALIDSLLQKADDFLTKRTGNNGPDLLANAPSSPRPNVDSKTDTQTVAAPQFFGPQATIYKWRLYNNLDISQELGKDTKTGATMFTVKVQSGYSLDEWLRHVKDASEASRSAIKILRIRANRFDFTDAQLTTVKQCFPQFSDIRLKVADFAADQKKVKATAWNRYFFQNEVD